MQKRILVIGSGISGLYCGIAFAQRGHAVTIVEKADAIGGLLGSRKNTHGDSFDFGTHFISATGNPEIDEILIPDTWRNEWLSFNVEKAGHYFNGTLDASCTFIKTSTLPSSIQQQCNEDLMNATGSYDKAYNNLKQQIIDIFGEGYYVNAFAPSLSSKFPGADLSDLVPDCHTIMGLKRLAILSQQETLQLKKNPLIDGKISFHRNQPSGINLYYPSKGGVGDWIDRLEGKARTLGVAFRTSTNIKKLRVSQKVVVGAEIGEDEFLPFDHVVSAITPALLIRLAAPQALAEYPPPQMVPTYLVHLTYDQAPSTSCTYIFNHDPRLRPFRITLYSNFQSPQAGRHRVTVETLGGEHPLEDIKRQLVEMGVVLSTANTVFEECTQMMGGFPYFTRDLEHNNQRLGDWCANNLENVTLVGRSGGRSWLMSDVLREAHASIQEFL